MEEKEVPESTRNEPVVVKEMVDALCWLLEEILILENVRKPVMDTETNPCSRER